MPGERSEQPRTEQINCRTGLARVWLGPEPERGAHSSIVGVLTADFVGVHVPEDAMYNHVDLGDYSPEECWPMGGWYEWSEIGTHSTIPWHRVNQIDWHDESDETVETLTSHGGREPSHVATRS